MLLTSLKSERCPCGLRVAEMNTPQSSWCRVAYDHCIFINPYFDTLSVMSILHISWLMCLCYSSRLLYILAVVLASLCVLASELYTTVWCNVSQCLWNIVGDLGVFGSRWLRMENLRKSVSSGWYLCSYVREESSSGYSIVMLGLPVGSWPCSEILVNWV